MRKYLSLTSVLLKGGMGMSDGNSKKGFKILLYVVLALSFLPLVGLLYFVIDQVLPVYAALDQAASILGSMMFLACMLIFIFSIFMIPSIFYFSSDNDILLALPLTPVQIIGSKFTVCLIYEYLFSLGVLLPTYGAYLHFFGFSITFVLPALIVLMLLPIYPLVLSTILTILLMRFVPFFKNRDRFNMISGILLLIAALAFSFASSSLDSSTSEIELVQMLLAGNNSMLDLFMKLFPMIPYFARGVVDGAFLDLLLGIAICIASLIVLLTLGKFLYFKGAIGNGESSSKHAALDEKQLHKAAKQGNKIWTYAMKDFKLLIRTPVYFMNCISMVVIFPILMIVLPMVSGNTSSQSMDISSFLPMIEQMDHLPAFVIIAGLGMGLMLGIMNLVSATAISREGSNYIVMKYLPISYADQIHAKSLCGIFLGILTIIFTIIPIMVILPLSPLYYLLFFVCACITTVLGNELCIIVDLAKPKLVWEQEAAAVKQNLGAFVSMMGGMALCVILIGSCFIIPSSMMMIFAIIALLLALVGAFLLYRLAGSYATKAMLQL